MGTRVGNPQLVEQVFYLLLFNSSIFVGFFFPLTHHPLPQPLGQVHSWRHPPYRPHVQCSLVLMQRNSLITQSYPELPWAVLKNEDAPALCHHFLGFVLDTKEQLSPLFPWYLVRIMTLPFIPVVKFPETVWTLQLEKHTTKENSLFLGLCEERTQSNDQYSNESLLTFAQGKVHLFIYFAWCFSDFFVFPEDKRFFHSEQLDCYFLLLFCPWRRLTH